jgi:hypothetical protein
MIDLQHLARCLSYDRAEARQACAEWAALPEPQQRALLDFADRAGLSLHLWRIAEGNGVADRLAHAAEYRERWRKNEIRLTERRRVAARLTDLLYGAGIPTAVWKGFLLAPDFVPSPVERQQNDIDLLLSPPDARRAFELFQANGYRALQVEQDSPALHLPMLIPVVFTDRRGDYFNPLTPPVVELHDRLWPSAFERIPVVFQPDPLTRIVVREGLPTLDLRDQLSACVLHAMRHIFRGSLRASHLYEIAGFLETHAENDAWWGAWLADTTLPPQTPLRELCVTGLALAGRVFHSRWPRALESPRAALPAAALRWIDEHGEAVLDRELRDKQQLLLQLAFVHGWRDRLLVLQRRLAPLRIPSEASPIQLSPAQRIASRTRLIARRAVFHIVTFFRFLRLAVSLWQ